MTDATELDGWAERARVGSAVFPAVRAIPGYLVRQVDGFAEAIAYAVEAEEADARHRADLDCGRPACERCQAYRRRDFSITLQLSEPAFRAFVEAVSVFAPIWRRYTWLDRRGRAARVEYDRRRRARRRRARRRRT